MIQNCMKLGTHFVKSFSQFVVCFSYSSNGEMDGFMTFLRRLWLKEKPTHVLFIPNG